MNKYDGVSSVTGKALTSTPNVGADGVLRAPSDPAPTTGDTYMVDIFEFFEDIKMCDHDMDAGDTDASVLPYAMLEVTGVRSVDNYFMAIAGADDDTALTDTDAPDELDWTEVETIGQELIVMVAREAADEAYAEADKDTTLEMRAAMQARRRGRENGHGSRRRVYVDRKCQFGFRH